MTLKWLSVKWKNYKHRFLPWIIFTLKRREIKSAEPILAENFMTSPADTYSILLSFFQVLYDHPRDYSHYTENNSRHHNNSNKRLASSNATNDTASRRQEAHQHSLQLMHETLGFCIERCPSNIREAGDGVRVTRGNVGANTMVALYPGTIYLQYEPVFFPSISNQFVFRCADGVLIDGKDKGLSRFIYKSCGQRDRCGPYLTCDFSWLTNNPVNPLAVGQYVNNHNNGNPANVAYTEFDMPMDFPIHLQQYIPNVYNSSSIHQPAQKSVRMVLLISTRNIEEGDELFSTYFTMVR